jgi:hypothetical protein
VVGVSCPHLRWLEQLSLASCVSHHPEGQSRCITTATVKVLKKASGTMQGLLRPNLKADAHFPYILWVKAALKPVQIQGVGNRLCVFSKRNWRNEYKNQNHYCSFLLYEILNPALYEYHVIWYG